MTKIDHFKGKSSSHETKNPDRQLRLQARVDSLSRAENDWENLLNSTDIATLFLTNESVYGGHRPATSSQADPGDVKPGHHRLASDLPIRKWSKTRGRC